MRKPVPVGSSKMIPEIRGTMNNASDKIKLNDKTRMYILNR